MNYERIKDIAKQIRGQGQDCVVSDLIALAPQNDPFYMGTPKDIENGKWFARLWDSFGYGGGVHLRRVHYQIISQETPVLMPNGKPYENTLCCWSFLEIASKTARYLEYVDPKAFTDRRNPDPHIYHLCRHTEPYLAVDDPVEWWNFDFPSDARLPQYEIGDYEPEQRYHLEVWCEKSTMNDVLLPLCEEYRVNLVTGVGEQSITSTLELIQRIISNGKPARVFYISDFDPAGRSMPVAVARKAEYFIQQHDPGIDFQLFPIMLTQDQCADYKLPRTPIKDTERRKGHFEDTFGTGATELDALEALYPGALHGIVQEHIMHYYDKELHNHVWTAKQRLRTELDSIRSDVRDMYSREINLLRMEYDDLDNQIRDGMDAHRDHVASLWKGISREMSKRMLCVDDYPIPEGREYDESDGSLFDSQRNYLTQLHIYKEFQGKSNGFGGLNLDLLEV